MSTRPMVLVPALVVPVLVALSGCAAVNTVSVQVSTFGQWPDGRAPGRYAFDRLPSQQAPSPDRQALEAAAAAALAQAGLQPAAGGEAPDLLVQLGAGNAHALLPEGDQPNYWEGGLGYWHPRRANGYSLGLSFWNPLNHSYDRSVQMLLRDRASSRPVLEVRATSNGFSALDEGLARLMFSASLADFPRPVPQQRTLRLPLAPPP